MAKTSKKKVAKKPVKKAKKKATKKVVKRTVKKARKAPKTVQTVKPIVDQSPRQVDVIPHSTKDNITPHDKFNSMVFILGLIAVIVLLIVVNPMSAESEPAVQSPQEISGTHLLLSLDSTGPQIGQEVTLLVEAKNFNDVVGFGLNLGFNPQVLEYEGTSYGNYLSETGSKICVPAENTGVVIKKIACVKLPDEPGHHVGVSGSGELLSVKFKVVGRGDPGFQIHNAKILNSERQNIEHQIILPNIEVR